MWASFCGWGGDLSQVTSLPLFLVRCFLVLLRFSCPPPAADAPSWGQLPARGGGCCCCRTEQRNRLSGGLIKLPVQSFPLNFATVIKWKSELSDLTEFYCSLFFWASFQNPFEKLREKSFFFLERSSKLLSKLLELFKIKCCRTKNDSVNQILFFLPQLGRNNMLASVREEFLFFWRAGKRWLIKVGCGRVSCIASFCFLP